MSLLAVNHHYYRERGTGRGIYPTSPIQMVDNIVMLRTKGWTFGSEGEISDYLAGFKEKKYVVITLDDGLKEQMKCLKDLEAHDVPALFFVSTGPLIEHRVLDVHKLHLIRSVMLDEALAARLDKRFNMNAHEFDDAVLGTQYRYDEPLSRRVKYFLNFLLAADAKSTFISELFTELHGDEKAAVEALYMNSEDWKLLAHKGYLGTHGHRHVPLATLTPEALHEDVELSIETLRDVTGKVVKGISYPYGGKTAVSDAVCSCAMNHGLTYGFTMQRGVNADHLPAGAAMLLNRIDVNDLPQYCS